MGQVTVTGNVAPEGKKRHAHILRLVATAMETEDNIPPASAGDIIAAIKAGAEALEAPSPEMLSRGWAILTPTGLAEIDQVCRPDLPAFGAVNGPLVFHAKTAAECYCEDGDRLVPVKVVKADDPA